MEQSNYWKFNFSAASQEIFGILLAQIYPVDTDSICCFKVHIFSFSPPGYSRQSLRQVLPPKLYTYFSSLPCMLHVPHRLTFLIYSLE